MKLKWLSNQFLGAFSDGAILIPMIAVLSAKSGYNIKTLLFSAGIIYCVSGAYFKIPMAVQPLKSLVITALAIQASLTEIRLVGALIGLLCLFLTLFDANALAKKVPIELIHGLQVALGVLLILQGFRAIHTEVLVVLVVLVIIYYFFEFPILGVLACLGILFSFTRTLPIPGSTININGSEFRFSVIISLLLPQIILTLSNSVIGTYHVSQYYFPKGASKVTPKRLLTSIGIGNILTALFAGLPFCHGSGGITAHYLGGARHYISNFIVGFFLIGVFIFLQFSKNYFTFHYPPILLSSLLISVGVFHIKLAKETWIKKENGKPTLMLMALTALTTQNLLYALGIGIFLELISKRIYKLTGARS